MQFRGRQAEQVPSDVDPAARKRLSRRRFLKRLAGACAAGTGVMAYGHEIGGNDLRVSHTHVSVNGWPPGAPPLTIGFLSDFHCDSDTAVERAHRATALLLAQRPDVVLLGGDYITWDAQPWIEPMVEALAPLAGVPGGAFGVLGNHDCWSGKQELIASSLGSAGIRILRNDSLALPVKTPEVWLIGIDNVTTGQQNPIAALSGVPDDGSAIRLCLVHEPDWADDAPAGSRFALQCSGHSHAGQVRFFGRPIYCPPLGRKYPQGLEQSPQHPVYTTRGIGMMHPQVRIDCPPEVAALTLSG